jgi:hypothetical protein
VSIIAFSVAIPMLAAPVMVNRQETFRGRRTPSVSVTSAEVIAQGAAFVGLVAAFWHIYWIATCPRPGTPTSRQPPEDTMGSAQDKDGQDRPMSTEPVTVMTVGARPAGPGCRSRSFASTTT